jgi:hypothetical protein
MSVMDRTDIDRRRDVEVRALNLRAERAELHGGLRENTAAITALHAEAVELGIAVEQFARLVGISRQSLYRWRDIARRTAKETQ